MMETILLEKSKLKVEYDLFTWSDNKRAPSPNCMIGIAISNQVLSKLSCLIWENSLEVLKEVPDYFAKFDEPYSSNKNVVLDNPFLLNEYFNKSDLWAEFIIEKLSILQKWDFKDSMYHLLKFKEVYKKDSALYLVFYAIKK